MEKQPIAEAAAAHPKAIEGLEIRHARLEELHADPANARAHGPENMAAIEASLARFGQAEPLIVQAGSGRVIGGNGRIAAMRKLGWESCDVVELAIDDLQATALGIALNRTGELAEWDNPALGRLLEELRREGELDGVRFDEAEVDELLAELEAELVEPGEVHDPGPGEPPEHPVSQSGDLWILGAHRLLCGDSTCPDTLQRLMAGEEARLLATDPPYLVGYRGGNHPQSWHNRPETKDKHWDDYQDPEAGLAFFRGFLEACLPAVAEDAPVYQWHAHRRQALVEQAWEGAGLLVHQQIIWAKARPVLTRSHYMWKHEPCFYGWKKGRVPPKGRRPPTNGTTVWEIDQVGQQEGIHPTQKPTELFARPIECHTRPGEAVLEPFSGSGTQIIAAETLGRRCFAIEISPGFVDVAVRRWEGATGKEAALGGTDLTFAQVTEQRRAR